MASNTRFYILMFLEARSLTLRCQESQVPFKALGDNLSTPLPASGCGWHSLVCGPQLQFLILSSLDFPTSLSLSFPCVSLLTPLVTAFRTHPDYARLSPSEILNLATSAKTLFQVRSLSVVPGLGYRHTFLTAMT